MARNVINIKDIDLGFKDLEKALTKAGEVEIGYFEGEKIHIDPETGDVEDLAEIAISNEFGITTNGISKPARPFVRTAVDSNKRKIMNFIEKQEQKFIDGKTTINKVMDSIGKFIKYLIYKRIKTAASWSEPNSPKTIAKKGQGKPPLTDTGQLARDIDYKKKVTK